MIPVALFPEKLKAKLFLQDLLLEEPEKGELLSDLQAMRLAIQEGYLGLGFVSPNPLVGCVILDSQNRFLSKGFHAQVGKAHAEINALKGLEASTLKGARVFVTLEPCSHEGRTGSCAKALAELPVAEVIYGLQDPNPLVSGKGAQILKDKKIKVTLFKELQAELEQLCEHFLWNQRQKKAFVTLKVASTLDGQMALKSGESQWITDETSREISHLLRAAHDAVLIGSGTVNCDNPKLNVRHPQLVKNIKVIVLDTDGTLSAKADQLELAKCHAPTDVYFVVSDKIAPPSNPWGAQVFSLPSEGLQLDFNKLIDKLWNLGIYSVFVEGGAQVLSSFLSLGLGQRMNVFQAPLILGAKSGKAWSEQVSIAQMKDRKALDHPQVVPLQNDILITGSLKT